MKKLFILIAAIACTLTLHAQGVAFEWQGLSLTHPSNYKITDKEFDGETYDFCCEIKSDDVSLINFSMVINGLFDLASKDDVIEVAKEGVNGAAGGMRKTYTDLRLGETSVNRNHRYTYVYRPFTGKLFGTLIYGKIIVIANRNKYVCMILQAESQAYLKELGEIANSVRID